MKDGLRTWRDVMRELAKHVTDILVEQREGLPADPAWDGGFKRLSRNACRRIRRRLGGRRLVTLRCARVGGAGPGAVSAPAAPSGPALDPTPPWPR